MSTRYIKTGDVAHRRIRREHLLVPVMSNMEKLDSIFSLNEVAGYIWDQLDPSATVDQITEHLIRDYNVDAQAARADTERILKELQSIGAVSTADEGQ